MFWSILFAFSKDDPKLPEATQNWLIAIWQGLLIGVSCLGLVSYFVITDSEKIKKIVPKETETQSRGSPIKYLLRGVVWIIWILIPVCLIFYFLFYWFGEIKKCEYKNLDEKENIKVIPESQDPNSTLEPGVEKIQCLPKKK